MKVSIRFCGGCNPRIDRGKIARERQKAFAGMGLDVSEENIVPAVLAAVEAFRQGQDRAAA